MNPDVVVAILLTVITASTPLLLAALGELVTERAGVLNLGVEGMMLMGAVTGFAVTLTTGSWPLGLLAAALAGAALALVFGVLTLTLVSNQVATGLALTIFGVGVSALVGAGFVGKPLPALPKLNVPGLTDLPVVGRLLFGHDVLVYLSILMTAVVAFVLNGTRLGLVLRAVGQSDVSAHAIGYPVIRIRYGAVLFGGVMSGLAGAYLSMAYTPLWVQEMTAGRGWIALALVVFAAWRPAWALVGAYIFGAATVLQLHAQAAQLGVPSQALSAVPYLATILALVLLSIGRGRVVGAPGSLGSPFVPDR